MTWNPSIPDLSNNISADYPDIKENLNELMLGMMNRPTFTYNGGSSAATIKISGGYYCCKDKFCYWASELTSTQAASGTPTADTWYYFYLDYSAITSGTALTNSEMIWSTTAPTYSHTYRGLYNGDDRCIFACLGNGAGNNFVEFFHDGVSVKRADATSDYAAGAPGSTWTDVTLTGPAFCKSFICNFWCLYVDGTDTARYRVNGQTGTTGMYAGYVTSTSRASMVVDNNVITDSSQKIEVIYASNSGDTITVYNSGWNLPNGM